VLAGSDRYPTDNSTCTGPIEEPSRVRIEARPDFGQTTLRTTSHELKETPPRHQTLETTDRFIELDYCEIAVPFVVYRGMGRKIRHLVAANGLVEITGRCIQRRFLLRPSPKLNAVIRGVLARAQERLQDLQGGRIPPRVGGNRLAAALQ
jgi:hypothetical protein